MTMPEAKEITYEASRYMSPYLLPSILPQADDISFTDSSFFAKHDSQLPTPAEVRRAAGANYRIGRPPPVCFQSLNLLVKYGSAINIAEGQCLWAIGRFAPGIPVPEIYGWRRDNRETFIYMEMVQGLTLEQCWPDLSVEERLVVCTQLRHIIENLRQLRQDQTGQFVGNINRQPLQDVIFDYKQPAGPFPDVKSFYDWFAKLHRRMPLAQDEVINPMRSGLQDDDRIVFTHGDLHRSNILVSKLDEEVPHVVAIIDWHQSGWYPAAWEFFKCRFTARGKERWEDDYIFEFLHSCRGNVSWEYFVHSAGI